MKRRDAGFRREEEGRSKLDARRSQGEGGRNAARVGDPAGRNHRNRDGIGNLRDERKGADLRGRIAGKEHAPVPACLGALRNDGIHTLALEESGFGHRSG